MHVTIDGRFMPDHANDIYARGEQNDVPVIVGTNTDEGTMFLGVLPFNTAEAYREYVATNFGDHADTVLGLTEIGSEDIWRCTTCGRRT